MTAPLVSVVVPCLNAGRMLKPALESILAQTHPALEIVFVDNGSTDGSMQTAESVLASGGRPHRIVHCAAPGVCPARNLGYGFAEGELIQWMDADDLMDPDKIALQVGALMARPEYDMAYCDYTERKTIPGLPQSERKFVLSQESDQIFRTLAGWPWYPPHSYLIRRTAAERMRQQGQWRDDLTFAEDREYFGLAALMGMRFLYVPGAHVVHNTWSPTQATRRTPYSVWVRSVADVFALFRTFAESSMPRGLLTARHRTLLNQDWTVVGLPPNSVALTKLDGRRVRLVHLPSGRALDMRPREAEILKAFAELGKPHPAGFFAGLLMSRPNPPTDDPVLVIDTFEKLRRAGVLVPMGERSPFGA